MAQRREWRFEYGIEEVKDAAEAKVTFHAKRVEFWDTEKANVMADIEEKGLEVRSHEITGGERAEVVIDPALQNRLNECQGKIKEHQRKLDEYESWAQVLHAQVMQDKPQILKLDHEDVQFFGLTEAGEEDD